jgi:hypothetical protein
MTTVVAVALGSALGLIGIVVALRPITERGPV